MDNAWQRLSELGPEDRRYSGMVLLKSLMDFDRLALQARNVRRQNEPHLPLEIECKVNEELFAAGRHHFVFLVKFTDGRRWVARVLQPNHKMSDDDNVNYGTIGDKMLEEVAIMEYVRLNTDIPVPKVHKCVTSLGQSNVVGCRYTLMDLVEGTRLSDMLNQDLSSEHFDTFVKQYAKYYYQLSCIRFPEIGVPVFQNELGQYVLQPLAADDEPCVPSTTSLQFFYEERLHTNRCAYDVQQQSTPKSIQAACQFLLQCVPLAVHPDHLNGPFPLTHSDLHCENILVDDKLNITGIIDWEDTRALPMELFATSQGFSSAPGSTGEENSPSLEFRTDVAKEVHRLAVEANDGLGIAIAELMDTRRALLAHRLAYGKPCLTMMDAKSQVLRLVYGKDVRWEDVEKLLIASPIFSELQMLGPTNHNKDHVDETHHDTKDDVVLGKRRRSQTLS